MEAIAISTRSTNLLLLNLRASRQLWRPSHLLLPRKQQRLSFYSRQCGLQITACQKLNVPRPNNDAHGPNHSEHQHGGHHREHGHDHSEQHHHGHHHQHGHVHKNLEHGQEDGQLNAAQKALLNLAKVTGWASLADLLRENFRLCSSSMVLLLLAVLCHYVQPKAAAKSAQNALIALALPLVGVIIVFPQNLFQLRQSKSFLLA